MNWLFSNKAKNEYESFKSALFKGDIAGVRDNMNEKYLDRSLDGEKKKPIHIACESGYIDIVKLLIEKNVNIECETKDKKRPIHFACESENIDIVKLLIEKNVDIECETTGNWRPIHLACERVNIDVVKLLIEKNVNVECETISKKKPIHFACEKGNIDIVKLLIEKNVDIECETKYKERPIYFACEKGYIDIVKLLIYKNVNIECEIISKKRPIHFACEKGYIDIGKLLIEKNVDIECETNKKERPIHFACKMGNVDIVKLLIEKNVNIECETKFKERPIHFACEKGYIDIVKLLIEKNVDVKCETNKKERPIHFSCESGNIDIVKLLIEKNVDIECETNYKKRPIHYACERGYIDIVKLLIEKNVDIECETNYKKRPIHYACERGYIDIVKLLIKKNVDIECESKWKERPIHLAFERGYIDIVKILIETNVNIECPTYWGLTSLEYTKKYGHESCVELLEKILKINDCVRQNQVSEFNKMYNSFICNDRINNIDLSVMKRAIGNNNNNSYQIIKLMMERNIDDAELIFLTNLLGGTENSETIALIKECILYKCIRDHHAEGFHKYCSADTINGQHKIIGSSFLEIAAQHGSDAFIERILKRSVYEEETWNRAVSEAERSRYDTIAKDIKDRERMIVMRERRHFSLLHTAVTDSDEDMVEYILKEKIVDPNINHKTIGTALALAYSLCHTRCITVLQQYNVDTNTQNKFGETPLHEAIASGTLEQCEYLVEKCNDIDKEGFNDLTALHCAVMEGCIDLCTQLIKKGADCTRHVHFSDPQRDNQYASFGERIFLPLSNSENSLTLCLKFNRTLYPCFLQQMDINKSNCCDSSKQSLLHLAALSLQPDICKLLLEAKALVNELNEEGNTCLLELLLNIDYFTGNNNNSIDDLIEVVKILIEFGADINVKTRSGQTVFQCASRYNNENLMITLLMNQADRISNTEDHFQWSFSQHWSQYPQILINLLSHECLSTFITAEIIHSVLNDPHSHLIKSLFDNANENVQQSVIEDILMRAARNEDKDLFDYFLEKDLVKTKLFENGETLLTNLLKDNNTHFCWILIRSKYIKYYVNMRNMNEQLPLQIATEMEEMNIVDALISDSKDINNEDKNGETAFITLLTKISDCNDKNMKNRLFVSINSMIEHGGNIYLSTSQKKTTIDYCTQPSVRIEIEQVYKNHQDQYIRSKEKTNEEKKNICPVCLDNEIDCVFECGHTFCMECSEELFKCPLCQHEPTNPKRIFI